MFASTLFIASWGFGFSALALAIAWRGSATLSILEFEMAPFNAWLGALAGLTCFALAMFWAGAFGFESRMSAIVGGVLAALAFRPVSTRVERMIRGD